MRIKKVRNAISYLMLLVIFSGLFAIFPNYFLCVIVVFLVCLGIYDVVSLICLVRTLEIKLRLVKGSIIKKNKAGIAVEVYNPTVFFSANVTLKIKVYNEFYGERTEVFFHIPVCGKQKGKISMPIEFHNCGRMRFELEEIKILGILGIVEWKQKEKRKKEDIFYSYPLQMDWQKKMEQQHGIGVRMQQRNDHESNQKGSDFVEVSGIREYIPGDRMRDIHWKLSAKREMLMVKEHVNRSDTQQIMLIELSDIKGEEGHDTMEEILELSTGVMKNLLGQEMGFDLFWWNQRTQQICHKQVQGTMDISEAMELLLDAEVYEDNQLLEHLWRSKNLRKEGYIWIGKNEDISEHKVIVKGAQGVVAKWEEG